MYLSSLMASDMTLGFMVTLTGSEGMMWQRVESRYDDGMADENKFL